MCAFCLCPLCISCVCPVFVSPMFLLCVPSVSLLCILCVSLVLPYVYLVCQPCVCFPSVYLVCQPCIVLCISCVCAMCLCALCIASVFACKGPHPPASKYLVCMCAVVCSDVSAGDQRRRLLVEVPASGRTTGSSLPPLCQGCVGEGWGHTVAQFVRMVGALASSNVLIIQGSFRVRLCHPTGGLQCAKGWVRGSGRGGGQRQDVPAHGLDVGATRHRGQCVRGPQSMLAAVHMAGVR